jgi:hypothetical protein
MADIKWIKLDTGIFDDEKIKIILSMPEGKSMLVIWLKLLCLAGRINNSGVPAWRVQQVSKAVKLPEGEYIDGIDGWFRLIQGRPVLVTTRQDDQGRAKVSKIEESRFPQVAAAGFVAVDDEPLPF